MRLPFRQRLLLILILLGGVPTAVAILGWALTVRSTTPAAAALRAMEDVGASGRTLLQTLDSTRLRPQSPICHHYLCHERQHRRYRAL